jgi:CRP-like cAMP-binding protein
VIEEMQAFLSTHTNFSEDEYNTFISLAQLTHYPKNEILLYPDKSVNTLFFLKKGLLRGYRLIDGNDVTHHFFLENWWATDYQAYITGNPGELYVETLTDTTVYSFNKADLDQLYNTHPKFNQIARWLGENSYLTMVERFKDFQLKELKERYLHLINANPALFNLVPQKHIASYLGVTPQSLSRIKEVIHK